MESSINFLKLTNIAVNLSYLFIVVNRKGLATNKAAKTALFPCITNFNYYMFDNLGILPYN